MSENPKEAAQSCAARRRVVALFLAFAAATPGAARGQDAIGRGRAYLASRQLPSGWFQGATPTDVVEALGVTDDADVRRRALLALALALAIPDNTEAALARLVALAGSPYAIRSPRRLTAWPSPRARWGSRLDRSGGIRSCWRGRSGSRWWTPISRRSRRTWDSLSRASPGRTVASDLPTTTAIWRSRRRSLWRCGRSGRSLLASGRGRRVGRVRGHAGRPGTALGVGARARPARLFGPARSRASRGAVRGARRAPGRESGAFDSDVRATALAIAALRTAAPDLQLDIPLVLDATPTTGQTYAVAARITNADRGRRPCPRCGIR